MRVEPTVEDIKELVEAEGREFDPVKGKRVVEKKLAKRGRLPSFAEIEVALRLAVGNITDAADLLEIEPSVLRRKVRISPNLLKIMQDIKETKLDLAEKKLLQQIQEGNTQATTFFLKTQGKERGYTEKTQLEHDIGEKTLSAASLIQEMRKGSDEVIDVEGRLLEETS